MAERSTNTTSGVLPGWVMRLSEHRGLIVPVGFALLLVVLLIPLPPPLMDILISLNIALAIIVLLTTMYMDRPLEFSVFPSLLLATTLLRLVLNVASTRLILTADAASPEEAMGVAGRVISAFGQFVSGDSLFVGIVIFMILVLVQFLVVTKGAGRVSEVAARFTLDAMPGKQMAIDSDLNAGIIDESEARKRREDINREADFFGAMDGASKFVRGDAIAGIIIIVINILGGFAIGAIERGWPAGQTAQVFTRLTIGDGLTSQIPSLIISIASALIVTRSGSKDEVGREITDQLVSQPKGLILTAALLGVLALSPLPTLPLLATGAGIGTVAFAMTRAARQRDDAEATQPDPDAPAGAPEPAPIESLLKIDTLELEVGYGLVGLVDRGQGGDLLDRISGVRRQIATEFGLVMPPVRIRDNVQLEPEHYRVRIRANVVAEGRVRTSKLLAMDPGIAQGPLDGEPTKEPAFGLDAWWIDPNLRARAETRNFTVVEPTNVIATHLSEITKAHAPELLSREEVNNLIEGLKERAPKLVEETIPSAVKPGELQKILQALLRERVPIRDLETIVETIAEWAPKTNDPDVLVEYVRNALRRTICHQYAAPADAESSGASAGLKLVCVALDPTLEDQINAYIDRGPGGMTLTMPARVAEAIAARITEGLDRLSAAGHPPVVVASPQVRAAVRQILEHRVPGVAVLGYNEVASGIEVETLSLITPPELKGASAA